MNSVVCQVLLFIWIVWIVEISGENQKIRIIIPHNINYIHHHHMHVKRENRLKTKFNAKHQRTHLRDEEKSEEEGRHGHWARGHDEESDATQRGIAYYAIPASEHLNNALRLIMKPAVLYNESVQRIPQSHDYFRRGWSSTGRT